MQEGLIGVSVRLYCPADGMYRMTKTDHVRAEQLSAHVDLDLQRHAREWAPQLDLNKCVFTWRWTAFDESSSETWCYRIQSLDEPRAEAGVMAGCKRARGRGLSVVVTVESVEEVTLAKSLPPAKAAHELTAADNEMLQRMVINTQVHAWDPDVGTFRPLGSLCVAASDVCKYVLQLAQADRPGAVLPEARLSFCWTAGHKGDEEKWGEVVQADHTLQQGHVALSALRRAAGRDLELVVRVYHEPEDSDKNGPAEDKQCVCVAWSPMEEGESEDPQPMQEEQGEVDVEVEVEGQLGKGEEQPEHKPPPTEQDVVLEALVTLYELKRRYEQSDDFAKELLRRGMAHKGEQRMPPAWGELYRCASQRVYDARNAMMHMVGEVLRHRK